MNVELSDPRVCRALFYGHNLASAFVLGFEGKRGQRTARLVFTDQPDPDIPLIAGDVLYNLRTAFDYLVGSLVPPSERSKVLCPLLHEPVWEIPQTEGESAELTRNREKWESLTRRIKSSEAVETLKDLMPLDARTPPPTMHPLDLLNRLSNRDRHRQLSVIAWGLGGARAKVVIKGSGEIRPAKFRTLTSPTEASGMEPISR